MDFVGPLLEAAPSPSPSAAPASFGTGVINFSFLLSLVVWSPVVMAFTPKR